MNTKEDIHTIYTAHVSARYNANRAMLSFFEERAKKNEITENVPPSVIIRVLKSTEHGACPSAPPQFIDRAGKTSKARTPWALDKRKPLLSVWDGGGHQTGVRCNLFFVCVYVGVC